MVDVTKAIDEWHKRATVTRATDGYSMLSPETIEEAVALMRRARGDARLREAAREVAEWLWSSEARTLDNQDLEAAAAKLRAALRGGR